LVGLAPPHVRGSFVLNRDLDKSVCGYILRPPLAVERLTESPGGQLLYHFRRPWRDGSTALLLEPLELLERPAAFVPPRRRPLLAYHGFLAPRAEWRATLHPADPLPLPLPRPLQTLRGDS
jgi:hypothetical protein